MDRKEQTKQRQRCVDKYINRQVNKHIYKYMSKFTNGYVGVPMEISSGIGELPGTFAS